MELLTGEFQFYRIFIVREIGQPMDRAIHYPVSSVVLM